MCVQTLDVNDFFSIGIGYRTYNSFFKSNFNYLLEAVFLPPVLSRQEVGGTACIILNLKVQSFKTETGTIKYRLEFQSLDFARCHLVSMELQKVMSDQSSVPYYTYMLAVNKLDSTFNTYKNFHTDG